MPQACPPPAPTCYHLQLAPGDLAPYVLTSGSPERVRRLAGWFDEILLECSHREFLTITGRYHDIPVSALATGIGPDNTAIAIIEAAQIQPRAAFIRVGSCGAIQPHIHLGDLIISTRALRRDGVTPFYAPQNLEALPDPVITRALAQAAAELGFTHHCGPTCTTNDFFHAQGRPAPGFPGFNSYLLPDLQRQGVLNLEMEMAVYFTLARVCRFSLRAGGLTAVYADRCRDTFLCAAEIAEAEEHACRTALRALELLAQQDREAGKPPA